jgi:hypothetical protein
MKFPKPSMGKTSKIEKGQIGKLKPKDKIKVRPMGDGKLEDKKDSVEAPSSPRSPGMDHIQSKKMNGVYKNIEDQTQGLGVLDNHDPKTLNYASDMPSMPMKSPYKE